MPQIPFFASACQSGTIKYEPTESDNQAHLIHDVCCTQLADIHQSLPFKNDITARPCIVFSCKRWGRLFVHASVPLRPTAHDLPLRFPHAPCLCVLTSLTFQHRNQSDKDNLVIMSVSRTPDFCFDSSKLKNPLQKQKSKKKQANTSESSVKFPKLGQLCRVVKVLWSTSGKQRDGIRSAEGAQKRQVSRWKKSAKGTKSLGRAGGSM